MGVDATTADAVSTRLADHTTFRVGGRARDLIVATSEAELVEAVTRLDRDRADVLVLGGGSNVLIGDDDFDGSVIKIATRGVEVDDGGCGGAVVRVAAGENWDAFVATAVEREWSGIEALAGIPGLVGATPIQNVGAYGAEVSQVIASVETIDRSTGQRARFAAADCGFGYRHSRFKAEPGRYLVLAVTFQLPQGSLSAPIRYAELARALDVAPGDRVPAATVREAVLGLRAGKGMVLDADDHDTWSAGSFFTNPVLTAEQADRLPADAPRFPAPDDKIKTSAAWLIDHAGFGKGYGTPPATLSTKHVLALTNRGGARAADLIELAREVRAGVRATYGIELVPEPVLVGCTL
ncbi:UDP-N-acetylmuramate dehydrogenase [Microlunatus parietis]|uniref:UDP-N-acetylenolpyruvoylglucosamine reductase n=1 Tax=Microlunatus parietis TaxID=682979 RepID=A0A7Y9I7Q4_9ACTN|nr:UDP-N-acetylmuramate dehydrogenase [Microlunatus parietis]NYE71299.1 UDP-N-acetylmuramate dehydrogenase [Microlunatus parietis]